MKHEISSIAIAIAADVIISIWGKELHKTE